MRSHNVPTDLIPTKIFADQVRRQNRSVVKCDLGEAHLELHSDAPGSRRREPVEDRTEGARPLREDDRGDVAVHGHRRIVEGPGSRSSWTPPTRDIRDEQTRSALPHVLDGEWPIHDRAMRARQISLLP